MPPNVAAPLGQPQSQGECTKFSVDTVPPVGVSSTLNSYAVQVVPEPHEYVLAAGVGLLGLAFYRCAVTRATAPR